MCFIILAFIPSLKDYLYKENITEGIEKAGDVIAINQYHGQHYIHTVKFIPEKQLKDYIFINSYREALSTSITESIRKNAASSEGFIPEIELPIKLPSSFKYIIGEGGNIKVTGSEDITLNLIQSTNEVVKEGNPTSFIIKPETNLQVKIKGTVGEKIHVDVDHSDKRASQSDNTVRVYYKSPDEDDIIRDINLGNSLKQKGSFGIFGDGKIANTSFDFGISKVQTIPEKVTRTISASSDTEIVYDKDFVKNKFFYLGLSPDDSIITLRVYYQNATDISSIPARLFAVDGSDRGMGKFVLKSEGEDEDYIKGYFQTAGGKFLPFLEILRGPDDNKMIAVYYIKKNLSTGIIDTVGHLGTGVDTSSFLLIKRDIPVSSDSATWNMMMRNVYPIGTTGMVSNLSVDIYRVIHGGDDENLDPTTQKTYLKILGLDLDSLPGIDINYVDLAHGYIFFPQTRPFDSPQLPTRVPEIYDKATLTPDEGRKYYLRITYEKPQSGIQLGPDVVESTEVIVVNGVTMQRGVDYDVNYDTGIVSFKPSVNVPSDAKIEYSYKRLPFVSFSSNYSSKLKLSTAISDKTHIQTTLQFNTSSSPELRPKLGEEPQHILLGTTKFNTGLNLSFLDALIEKIPFIGSEKKTSMNLNLTYGFSLPNPATNGKGYIDDMEETKKMINFPSSRREWYYGSIPKSNDVSLLGEIHWWNFQMSRRNIAPEYPQYQEAPVYALALYFVPRNNDPNSWGSINTIRTAEFDLSNYEFIEFWAKGDSGVLHIDLGGDISEDIPRVKADGTIVPPNGLLDTEDKDGNGVLSNNEDTGLDGVQRADFLFSSPDTSGDDGNDDFQGNPKSFEDTLKLNGTEGNLIIDSEDLNRDAFLDTNSNYFEVTINFMDEKYVVANGLNGWKKYRVVLHDTTNFKVEGNPSWTNIRYLRIWFDGVKGPNRIGLTNFGVVGNNWMKEPIEGDSLSSNEDFVVGYRSSFEDSSYKSPVEVERNPYGGILEEKSLSFILRNFESGHTAIAKNYLGKGKDFRNYGSLKFYSKNTIPGCDSVNIFIRVATDSANYYEYSRVVLNDGLWDTINIPLTKFTSLKRNPTPRDGYSMTGKPTLKSIEYIYLGVKNIEPAPINGEVLFDDVYLENPNRTYGNNIDLLASGNIGDFSTLRFRFNTKNANYKSGISDLKKVGENQNLFYEDHIVLNLDRLFLSLMNVPVTYNFKYNRASPLYYRNSDQLLGEDRKSSETSLLFSKDWTVAFKTAKTYANVFGKYLLEPLSGSVTKRFYSNFIPYLEKRKEIANTAEIKYVTKIPTLKVNLPFNQFISFLPNNFSINTKYNFFSPTRFTFSTDDSQYIKQPLAQINKLTGSFSTSYSPISFISANYSAGVFMDNLHSETFYGKKIPFVEKLTERLSLGKSYSIPLNKFILNYTAAYEENSPYDYIHSLGDTLKVMKAGARKNISMSDNIDWGKVVMKIPLVNKVIKSVNPLLLKGSIERITSYGYLSKSPNYSFRFGTSFTPDGIVKSNPYDLDKETRMYDVSTGLGISSIGININGHWIYEIPHKSSNPIMKKTVAFPNISGEVNNIERFLRLRNLFRQISATFAYSRDSTISYSMADPDVKTKTVNRTVTPTIKFTLKNKLGFNIDGNFNERTYRIIDRNDTTMTHSENWNINGTTGYTISPSTGIKLPFRKRKIRLKSSLRLALKIGVEKTKEVNYISLIKKSDVRVDRVSYNADLSGSYSFTKSVQGSLGFTFKRHMNYVNSADKQYSYGGHMNVKLIF